MDCRTFRATSEVHKFNKNNALPSNYMGAHATNATVFQRRSLVGRAARRHLVAAYRSVLLSRPRPYSQTMSTEPNHRRRLALLIVSTSLQVLTAFCSAADPPGGWATDSSALRSFLTTAPTASQGDWLVHHMSRQAGIYRGGSPHELLLDNGLVRRRVDHGRDTGKDRTSARRARPKFAGVTAPPEPLLNQN